MTHQRPKTIRRFHISTKGRQEPPKNQQINRQTSKKRLQLMWRTKLVATARIPGNGKKCAKCEGLAILWNAAGQIEN